MTRRARSLSTTRPSAAPPAAQIEDEPTTTIIADGITLADAGRILHASPAHLVRCFSGAFGISPHRYLLARRIDAARHRLLRGEPVAEVAAGVGFHDQPHLTRVFRRHVGTTPASYASAIGRRGGD